MIREVPRVAVDAVLLHDGKLVLVLRRNAPFKGKYALPGGFVEFGEALEDAVRREVREETGLAAVVQRLLGVYGGPDRDPRGHTISVAYVLHSTGETPRAGSDAAATKLVRARIIPHLAFDHSTILKDYLRTLGGDAARRHR